MTIKLICAFILAFLFATAFGKYYIPWLRKQKAGQEIKKDGPTWHMAKSGTPTMGGVMFILAVTFVCLTIGFPSMLKGNFVHIFVLLFALVFGAIGLLDDWEKIKNKQNLGLTAKKKFLLQLAAAIAFTVLLRYTGYLTPDQIPDASPNDGYDPDSLTITHKISVLDQTGMSLRDQRDGQDVLYKLSRPNGFELPEMDLPETVAEEEPAPEPAVHPSQEPVATPAPETADEMLVTEEDDAPNA